MNRFEYKIDLQNWLKTLTWNYFITVEPYPSNPWSQDEIAQTFRQLEFMLNKKHLKSSFTSWNDEDRFWMVMFQEGDGDAHEIHYHALLHVPQTFYKKNWYRNVGQELLFGFLCMRSKKSIAGKSRKLIQNGKPVIDVQAVRNNDAVVTYSSKWIDKVDAGDNFCFITPPKNTHTK